MAQLCQWAIERMRSFCPRPNARYKKTDERENSDDERLMDEEEGRQPYADCDNGVADTLRYHPYTDDPRPDAATTPYRDNPTAGGAEDRYTDNAESPRTGMFTPENSPGGSPRDDGEDEDNEEEYLVDPSFNGGSAFEDPSENLVPAAPHTIDQPMHVGTTPQVLHQHPESLDTADDPSESLRKMEKDLDDYLRSMRSESTFDPLLTEDSFENKGDGFENHDGMDLYPDIARTSTV